MTTSENAILVLVVAYGDTSLINSSMSLKSLTESLTIKQPSPAIL